MARPITLTLVLAFHGALCAAVLTPMAEAAALGGPSQERSARSDIEKLKARARGGDRVAQYELALRFRLGDGVPKDAAAAVVWFRKAARQGYASAMNAVGVCYRSGGGVRQDDRSAVSWYRRAAERGDSEGQVNLGAMLFRGKGGGKARVAAFAWTLLAAGELKVAKENLKIMAKKLRPSEIERAHKVAARMRKRIAHRTRGRKARSSDAG